MSAFKVEYAPSLFAKGYHCEDDVPVVRLEALRAWLEAHQYPRQYGATAHNGVIDDLLEELKDLA